MNIYRSYTTTLIQVLRGSVSIKELDESLLLVNCSLRHALPWFEDREAIGVVIGMEAAWAVPMAQRSTSPVAGHLMNISSLPVKLQTLAVQWNYSLDKMYHEDRLYIRAGSAQLRKEIAPIEAELVLQPTRETVVVDKLTAVKEPPTPRSIKSLADELVQTLDDRAGKDAGGAIHPKYIRRAGELVNDLGCYYSEEGITREQDQRLVALELKSPHYLYEGA